jgi:hypothetical protein
VWEHAPRPLKIATTSSYYTFVLRKQEKVKKAASPYRVVQH